MRLSRLYTRTGDDGTTRLADGQEVRKDCARVAAYGAVDELNAWLGVVLAGGIDERLREWLTRLQNQLFDLGADLASPRAWSWDSRCRASKRKRWRGSSVKSMS